MLEVVDEPADTTSGQDDTAAEVLHAQASSGGRVQYEKHVVPRQRHLSGLGQILLDGPDDTIPREENASPRRHLVVDLSHDATLQVACGRTYLYDCVQTHTTEDPT